MCDGVDASRPEYFIYIYTFPHRPCAKLVDMPLHQAVRVLIITAEHHLICMIMQQVCECFEIFCCTPFPDDDLHSVFQFIQRFFPCKTFMVCGNSSFNILPSLFSSKTRCMSVNWFAQAMCY